MSYAEGGPFLAFALAVLAENVPQRLGNAVDAELPPEGKRPEELRRASFADERLEGQRHAGKVFRRRNFVELARVAEGQLLAVVDGDFPGEVGGKSEVSFMFPMMKVVSKYLAWSRSLLFPRSRIV